MRNWWISVRITSIRRARAPMDIHTHIALTLSHAATSSAVYSRTHETVRPPSYGRLVSKWQKKGITWEGRRYSGGRETLTTI